MKLPEITERMINECMDEIPIKADREYIRSFILSGQEKVREITVRYSPLPMKTAVSSRTAVYSSAMSSARCPKSKVRK